MGTIQALIEYESFSSRLYGCETASTNKAKYNVEIFEKCFREAALKAGYNADDPFEEENSICKT